MQIFAKTWNSAVNSSKTIILDVEPEDLIEDVKDELRHKLGISPLVDVQLRFCSKILNNGQSLSSCNVTKEANIDVFLRKMSTSIPPSNMIEIDLSDYSEDSDDDIQNTDDREDNEWDTKILFASEDNDAQTTNDNERNAENSYIPDENGAVMLVTTNDDTKKDEIEDVFQKFHDDFGKLMASKTSKEIELRATTFKEKHDENIIISEKISNLKISHDNNAKEIKKEMEKIQVFRTTSLLTYDAAKLKKDDIDAKIKELQKESSELERLMNSEHRKIKIKEDEHEIWMKQKEMENGNLTEKIDSLQKRKLINDTESEELYNTDFEFKKKSTIVNETLVEFISKSIDEKMKDLECPVCFVAAETPICSNWSSGNSDTIFMCASFHLICEDCLPEMTICPVCRAKYPEHPPRHRFAEKMDQEIKKLSMDRQAILDAI